MEERTDYENQALALIGQIAVSEAMWVALRAHFLPWTAQGGTSALKEIADDPAKAIDMVAEAAITRVLTAATRTPDTPLARGCLVITEERALFPLANPSGEINEDLLVFVDPVDFTAAACRGLDGSVLISFYEMNTGFRAAVVGDIYRRRLYTRRQGRKSEGMSVMFNQDPLRFLGSRNLNLETPTGAPMDLHTSGRESLEEASVNIFLGKRDRLIKAATEGSTLWNWENKDQQPNGERGVKEIFSVGGSLGPVRVAEGTWDASVEIVKGFRTWDFAPGAFIAEGAGAAVVDLKGQRISFDTIPQMKAWRSQRFTKDALDATRQKFIVAATDKLAQQIVSVLAQHNASKT